jgi:hypothetical protein
MDIFYLPFYHLPFTLGSAKELKTLKFETLKLEI